MENKNNKPQIYSLTEEEKEKHLQYLKDLGEPIYRGCLAAEIGGGCMCTGRCREILGYKKDKK